MSTSSESSSFSGDTRSKRILSAIHISPSPRASRRVRPSCFDRLSMRAWFGLRRVGGHLLRLGDRFFDGANHIEGLLRQMVVLAVHDRLERTDVVGELHELARLVGELLRHMEGLREE